LSGKTHQVITAIAFVLIGENSQKIVSHQITEVKIKELVNGEIDAYVASEEPLDKAGAYAIQGLGVLLTEGISGCYTNVVGLPVPLLAKILKKEFGLTILGD